MAAGYNFFVFEAALVPFEVTACNVVINYWSAALPVGATIAIVLVLYALVELSFQDLPFHLSRYEKAVLTFARQG